MTVFSFGLEWDCITLANKIKDSFRERNMTDEKGRPIDKEMTFGMSDEGEGAFIIKGFDTKNKFGLVVTMPTDKQEIHIIGGKYKEDASLKSTYNKTFSDLLQASKYFEQALKDYEKEFMK